MDRGIKRKEDAVLDFPWERNLIKILVVGYTNFILN